MGQPDTLAVFVMDLIGAGLILFLIIAFMYCLINDFRRIRDGEPRHLPRAKYYKGRNLLKRKRPVVFSQIPSIGSPDFPGSNNVTLILQDFDARAMPTGRTSLHHTDGCPFNDLPPLEDNNPLNNVTPQNINNPPTIFKNPDEESSVEGLEEPK